MSLYYPTFFRSYLASYVKISLDPNIYKTTMKYSGSFFGNPNIPKEGDYVTSKYSLDKIYKVIDVWNHEVTLLDFDKDPIDKETFDKNVENEKKKIKLPDTLKGAGLAPTYPYFHDGNDGGSRHMYGTIYELYNRGYGKNINPMTMEEINNEKMRINNIRKNNVEN